MSFMFLHKPKPKRSRYKPVFYKDDSEEMTEEKKKFSIPNDKDMSLEEKIKVSWSKERKHEGFSRESIIKTFIVLLLLILLIFFVKIG
jgi:hypothetical protein